MLLFLIGRKLFGVCFLDNFETYLYEELLVLSFDEVSL